MTTEQIVLQAIAETLKVWGEAYLVLVNGEAVAVVGDAGAARCAAQNEAEKVGRENVRLVRVTSLPV